MNLCIIGSGYVGLVTGTCFAELGNTVICIDKDDLKIENLKKGEIPIFEPGLAELVHSNMKEKRLFFSTDIKNAIETSDLVFISVGTPSLEDGSSDMNGVFSVARSIGEYINEYKIIINKSTVPVGSGENVKMIISNILKERNRNDIKFDIVSNPEFLKEGAAIEDFLRPDRIVIGFDSQRAKETMLRLYEPFVKNQHPIIFMDMKSAELTKYASNAMLATRISFMNELAILCDRVGADISMIRQGVGLDSRIGMSFLYAGIGYGGSCFPKDVSELISTGKKFGLDLSIINSVKTANEIQKNYLINIILKEFDGNLKGKIFALWGLAFKPQTDDMRDAPSINIINKLIKEGAILQVYDPEAMINAKKVLSDIQSDRIIYCNTQMDALISVDGLIIATEWRQFRQPDFNQMKILMKKHIIFDGRNIFSNELVKDYGFKYFSIGRNNKHL